MPGEKKENMGIGRRMLTLLVVILLRLDLLLPATLGNSNIVMAATAKNEIDQERRKLASEKNLGLISIDCGAEADYLDEKTQILYKSDKDFVSTGENREITPESFNSDDDLLNNNFGRLSKTVRSFPDGKTNCYTLKPEQGKDQNYLIRLFFKYGNYDLKNQVPGFDVYLGATYYTTVRLANSNEGQRYSAVHSSASDYIFVCLVNTNNGTPFLSAMEVRHLNNSIYRTGSRIVGSLKPYDVGAYRNSRYNNDIYDRIWLWYKPDGWNYLPISSINIPQNTSSDSYKVPSQVLSTAARPRSNFTSLSFYRSYPFSFSYCTVYLYFCELEDIPGGQMREFTITVNGVTKNETITLEYLKPLTVSYENVQVQGNVVQFFINKTLRSDLVPILNGFEILMYNQNDDPATNTLDVDAIMAIKRIYEIVRPDWQGDPCVQLAKGFSWSGFNCSNYNNTLRITSLNLASSNLKGEIASEFSNLQAIQYLDLSNNELTGTFPEFLAHLPNLTTLSLTGNKLTGPLPQSLMEKSRNGTLLLSFDEKSKCSTDSCKVKKQNFILPILVSVISLLVLLPIIIAIIWRMRTKEAAGSRSLTLKLKNRSFTYNEIVIMTNNFSHVIGEGGFGKVYLGSADGTQVAVKLLSQSSQQGFKEFQSEVQLLTMVYHRNLVSLIGHCDDHGNMVLIYEYMENGNLREHLSDRSMNVMNWRLRLQIAVDAAYGLEYLHNGCKPPIIHRDLKSSNILLNENFLAKISDFGLSRVFATDNDTHVSTNPAGTLAYADPANYASGNKKSDVYSFGIILFELITGQPVVVRGEEYSIHIVHWVRPMIESGDIQSIVDPKLEGEFNTNSAWKFVEVAMSCVPPSAIQRPDMSHVLAELKECLEMEMASAGAERTSQRTTSYASFEMNSMDVNTIVAPRVR